jgi:thiamine biosynthesis lipoprotein
MRYSEISKRFLVLLLLPLLVPAGCARGPVSESDFILGTVCTVTLYGQRRPEVCRAVFRRLRELEDTFSANREGTDLDRLNRSAGIKSEEVDLELVEVLERALYYAKASGGAFDPTVGPLVKLWGIGTDASRIPSDEEIGEALALIDYNDIEIDKTKGRAFLTKRGMALDLGAIAKGYAADEAVKILVQNGIKRGIIDLGGNIFAYGEREKERPWRIGVQDPRESRGAYIGVLELRNKSVVTSGVYERYFEEDGKRYHHILSTITGRPVETGLLSVTIIAGSSIDADALSTAAFALGPEKGRRLIESIPGAEAIFVFEDLSIALTLGIKDTFSLTDEAGQDYRVNE